MNEHHLNDGLQIDVIGQVKRNPRMPSLFARRKEEGDVVGFLLYALPYK
jgi:hypothetical protein